MAVMLCLITLILTACSAGSSVQTDAGVSSSSKTASSSAPVSYDPPANEMRGVWVATAWGADFPQSKTASGQQAELRTIVDNAKAAGLNTVIFQVRTWSDAMYHSSIYPWSALLNASMKQGVDPGYDPLGYLITYAHSKGIKVQAWINPYRISSSDNNASISPCSTNPAVSKKYPTYTYAYKNITYSVYDPASQIVRDLITNGVTEIVKNYDVDGIQFDDFFYPTAPTFDDSEAYANYQDGGGSLSLDDWRRENVDKLIEQVHTAVHKEKNIEFGISPAGIWQNISYTGGNGEKQMTDGTESYDQGHADSALWVEKHWVDYICPQIYWGFNNPVAPFAPICDWWSALCKKYNVKLYVGLVNTVVTGGQGVFTDSKGINEVQYARSKGASGVFLFHSAELNSMADPLKGMFTASN